MESKSHNNAGCMDHSGVLARLSDHSKRIEVLTRGLDSHLKEHRQNSAMLTVTALTSGIAAVSSIIVALISVLG